MNLCNFSGSKFLFYINFKHLGAQEIIVIVLIVLSLIYLGYRLRKKAKDHDCDNCGHNN